MREEIPMICKEIISRLQQHSKEEYACEWDNVGLLVGDSEKEVNHIYIALDATDEVVEDVIDCGADFLLTHHPMIFKGMKKIVADDFIGRRILKFIQNDISYYAMHTNFDMVGMADLAVLRLGLTNVEVLQQVKGFVQENGEPLGIGKVGDFSEKLNFHSCVELVKKSFQVDTIKVFSCPKTEEFKTKEITRVAICPGSGKSVVEDAIKAKAEILITGDIDHHQGIDAAARGLIILDAGHYGIEKMFVPYMGKFLREQFPQLKITEEKEKEPFRYV